MSFSFHPFANLFPLIEGQEFLDLAEDIRERGIVDRIDLLDQGSGEGRGDYQILDGRNRYRALVWLVSTGEVLGPGWGTFAGEAFKPEYLSYPSPAGLPALFERFQPEYQGEPLDYVLSKNLKRRHLDESQRAMVAARLANLDNGGDRKSDQTVNLQSDRGVTRAQAADMVNVSERAVNTAKAVQRSAAPEIVEAVDRGHLAVSAAAEIAAQPAERQAAIVKALPRDAAGKLTADVKKALAPVIKELRAEKVAAKRERREEREETLGRRLQALPDKTFGVAIEDFEWHHDAWSAETGMERHPSMHYETADDAQTPEQIVARCAERFACLADDCVLFKWTTSPHLAIAIRVLELQGFRYVTNLVWNKERTGAARGTGYWFTGEHELVLVGVRGKAVPPSTAHFRSSFSAPIGDHSEKPGNIHDIVEFHWPNTPKVEFNARRSRQGWTAWGFDAPVASPSGEVDTATDAAPSPSSVPLSEFDALTLISEAATPDRARRLPGIIAPYLASGLAAKFGAMDDYALTEPGWGRLIQLQKEQRAAATAAADGDAALAAVAEHPAHPEMLQDCGIVTSEADQSDASAAALSVRSETAVPPAGPGSNSGDDLGIPLCLRRAVPQAELDLARRDVAPPEVVDNAVQVRLPLTEDELAMHAALSAVAAGRDVEWSELRHLVGAGFVFSTTERLVVTDEGRKFLAMLPDLPSHEVAA